MNNELDLSKRRFESDPNHQTALLYVKAMLRNRKSTVEDIIEKINNGYPGYNKFEVWCVKKGLKFAENYSDFPKKIIEEYERKKPYWEQEEKLDKLLRGLRGDFNILVYYTPSPYPKSERNYHYYAQMILDTFNFTRSKSPTLEQATTLFEVSKEDLLMQYIQENKF